MSEIKLKKGDKVVMHTCLESKGKNFGKVWTCHTDSFKCEAGIEVVFLEGFSGFFYTKFLQPVKLDSFCNERIKSLEASLLDVSTQATKRIGKLKKENAELKKEAEKHKWNNIFLEDCAVYDKKIAEEYTTLQECIKRLEKENAELKADNDARKFAMAMSEKVEKQLREENAELKAKVGLSIDCEKAQKNGELCLGYGSDEDEPCERCKNCIKCECGYYQLGETEKDDQLTNAKELLKRWVDDRVYTVSEQKDLIADTEQFIREVEK